MPPRPTIQRMPRPTANGAVSAASGSVLSEVRPIAELPEDFLRFTVYGENRVGKSTLCCGFPKPLLLLSFEPNPTGGALSVRKTPGVNFLRVTDTAKAVRLAQELAAADPFPFKTVVIDSATSLQDVVLNEILGPTRPEILGWGTVSRDQYRERSEKTRECLRPFFALPCHTVVIAKMRDHNRQEGDKPKIVAGLKQESFYGCDLGGATAGWLHDCSDFLAHLTIDKEVREVVQEIGDQKVVLQEETGKVVRRLRCQYHPNFAAGFRSATPGMVPEYIDDPDFSKIMAVVRGEPLPKPKGGK